MKFKLSLITVALLLSWSATAIIPQTQKQIEAICSNFGDAQVGVFALNSKGDTVVAINSGKRFVPASNIKLITTGLALKVLGKNFRYQTTLAYSGEIVDGILFGDLYIIGGGDPTLDSKTFGTWKKYLSESGIDKINGRIIGDSRGLDSRYSQHPTWQLEDAAYYYGTAISALNFYKNTTIFAVRPAEILGQKPQINIYYPQAPWLQIENNATTGPKGSSNKLRYVNTSLYPIGGFTGSFPIDRKQYSFEASNPYSALTCAYYFHNYLIENNIEVVDGYADIDLDEFIRLDAIKSLDLKAEPRDSLQIVGSSYSAALSQIIQETNFRSDNFYAETLFNTITTKSSTIDAALNSIGIATKQICQIKDGSGLSRNDYISPEFFVNFLMLMSKDEELFPVYLQSIPMPGSIKSTLEFKFAKYPTEFKKRIRMKSGSMNGIRAYSGYILSDDDPQNNIAFSIICNNLTARSSQYMSLIDSIIEILTAEN